MRTPPLLADFIQARGCKPKCEKSLTLPFRVLTVTSGIGHTPSIFSNLALLNQLAQHPGVSLRARVYLRTREMNISVVMAWLLCFSIMEAKIGQPSSVYLVFPIQLYRCPLPVSAG